MGENPVEMQRSRNKKTWTEEITIGVNLGADRKINKRQQKILVHSCTRYKTSTHHIMTTFEDSAL
jgi:hypothetical protein